ncbi:proton-conducting transporter membrane subunit [Thermomonas flagellata]|uniref:proton-conducting transporter transmembrane domain-containing protein n=1 Tax=Thermomonas flagellata TaxID=2888524 RepID=UPI001F034BC5|nr:proton-conducting transporter membrane subunit [Thermomonas flagellata]
MEAGLLLLLPLLPVLAALAVQCLAPARGARAAVVSIAVGWIALALTLLLFGWTLRGGQAALAGLRLDPLAALMALLIAGIGQVVRLYSRRYMAEEPGYRRHYVLLDAMIAVLLLVVLADHLLLLVVGWYLVGVLLYWLLGQDLGSRPAHRYAGWTFLTYRLGDVALILAAVLLWRAYGSWSLHAVFAALQAGPPPAARVFGLPLLDAVAVLVAVSAFARSAQFLLHTWLPYTMHGPTPVSALMHAGIVNAGGFLFNRFAPLLVHTGEVLHWSFVVGLVTAVVGSVLMLTQNDIKKSLGYSTMGQMGFMVMEVGVGAFALAIYHLVAHGLFKGTLFLGAGGVIGEARRHDGVPPNPLYAFAVERRPGRGMAPWLPLALVSLVLPLAILAAAHWLVAPGFTEEQGAVVLLIFAWLAGAQLMFATHQHLGGESPWRNMVLVLASFILIVFGYTLVSHLLAVYLYPDPQFRARIYEAAGIDLFWFDLMVVVIAVAIVVGWFRLYRAEREAFEGRRRAPGPLWLAFYALISREFYVADVQTALARMLLALSQRLNLWLRWA